MLMEIQLQMMNEDADGDEEDGDVAVDFSFGAVTAKIGDSTH